MYTSSYSIHDSFYVRDAETWRCDKKERAYAKRRADLYMLFCRLMGVDEGRRHDFVLNYYEYFKGIGITNTLYNVRYNKFMGNFFDKKLSFDHDFWLYSHWLKETFFVSNPYRNFKGAEKYIVEDREQIASINAKHPDNQRLELLILDAKYSWHYQYHTSLYIVGTADFIAAIQPAIEKYKYYVDKYYSKDI